MKTLNKKTITIIAILLIIVIFLIFRTFQNKGASIAYKTAKVDKGDIISYVTATGTLNPISTVEIGSQVSGAIKNTFVDFNSVVKKGDPLAEIDPTPLNSQLKQAQADLNKAEADAEIAKANLDNTTIRSPIDGIVISRKINISQIVTSGQSSSPLFLIAEDLSRMKLDAHVSEADIGKAKNEQEAEFSVDAYPNKTFKGKVWQIQNKPIATNNVITYDVVILIDNNDLKLKPGMTAEVKILLAKKKDVLRVPTAVLRFIPPPYALVDEGSIELNNTSVAWVPLKNGRLKAVSINPGVSDEAFTEILDGNLGEGEKVIVEATENTGAGSEPLGPIVLPKPQRF